MREKINKVNYCNLATSNILTISNHRLQTLIPVLAEEDNSGDQHVDRNGKRQTRVGGFAWCFVPEH